MSFLKKLFGLGGASDAPAGPAAPSATQEHKGFTIAATPFKEAGQYQLSGVISKEIGGEVKEHRFIRADRFGDQDTAVEMVFMKARQIIDEQGDRLFS